MKKKATRKKKFTGYKIDIETRSRVDISAGAYRYAECPDFRVLIISYAPIWEIDGKARLGAVRTLDLSDSTAVARFTEVITNPRYRKDAFNANFERISLSRWAGLPDGQYIDPRNWRCSAVRANVHGVFGTLDEVAKAVRSPIHKDSEGRRLINLFSKPDKKTGAFHEPGNEGLACWCGAVHQQDFAWFQGYCEQDVMTEAVAASAFPETPDDLQYQYEADQRINDRGVRHFSGLSRRAVELVEIEKLQTMAQLKALTGLENPNSNQQMLGWVADRGYPMSALHKEARAEALADPIIPDEVAEALTLKGKASLSSASKHQAMLKTRCNDGRIRGSLQFYGAHTGREAGRGFQPQNLPKYEAPKVHRVALLRGDLDHLMGETSAAEVAKGTVRPALVPAKNHVFVTADYNAIEARVLAGLAGEKASEAEFRGKGKIYERTASRMFGVDYDQLLRSLSAEHGCDKCGKLTCKACVLRGQGKVSELALGFAGGAGALVTMGAEDAGIDIGNYKEHHAAWLAAGAPGKFHEWERDDHDYPELLRLRDLYRDTNPATTRFWRSCANAWDAACQGKASRFGQYQSLAMLRDGRHNRFVLPSGRSIWYRFANSRYSDTNPDRVERRTFIGKSKGVGHTRVDTHGGKLTENVTQAVARDVLFDLLMRIEAKAAAGWPARTILHVHDEVVLEVHKHHADQVLADTVGMMSQPPSWGSFLLVKGEGKIMERYGK